MPYLLRSIRWIFFEFYSLHWKDDVQESSLKLFAIQFLHNQTFVTAKELVWFRKPIAKLISMFTKGTI